MNSPTKLRYEENIHSINRFSNVCYFGAGKCTKQIKID